MLSEHSHLTCIGGVSTHLELTTRLLIQMGHEVTVICPAGPEEGERYKEIHQNGIRILCVPGVNTVGNNRKWIQGSRELFLLELRDQNIDFIFSESTAIIGVLNEILRRQIPCFCFLHNFAVTHFYNVSKEIISLRSFLYYFCISVPKMLIGILKYELPVFRKCTKILSGSLHNAKRIKKSYMIGWNKIETIQNWVDTSMFYPSNDLKRRGRERWNITTDHVNFLMVGSSYVPKGFHIAIKAFARSLIQVKNARLWIAGSGRERHRNILKNTCIREDLTIGEEVFFLGAVNHPDLPMLYNAADIFIIPSLLIEVLPLVLLEAMACGLPCIASDIGGNPEALYDAGMLYSPRDNQTLSEMMRELGMDHSKRKYYGQKARQRVLDKFSEEIAMNKLKALLET